MTLEGNRLHQFSDNGHEIAHARQLNVYKLSHVTRKIESF